MPLIFLDEERQFKNKLGAFITWKHKTTGISQAVAGRYLGISQQAYSRKLKKVSFKPYEVQQLFTLFNATEDEILKLYERGKK